MDLSSRNGRRTIGIFIDWTDNEYHVQVMSGINEFACRDDCNVLCFEGGTLEKEHFFDRERNIIFRLATKEKLDGLIIMSASIGYLLSDEEFLAFLSPLRGIPVVSIGRQIPGVPSILVDNACGFQELLDHCLDDHGFRRFIFLNGAPENTDAVQRRDLFIRSLSDRRIPIGDQMIYNAEFNSDIAIRHIRNLSCEFLATVDAIVCANDEMALAVQRDLQERNARPKPWIPITGFDDVAQSRNAVPSLTTVRQPLFQIGTKAMDLIMMQLSGAAAPDITIVPTEFILRESCGCTPEALLTRQEKALGEKGPIDRDAFAAARPDMVATLSSYLAASYENIKGVEPGAVAAELIDLLFQGIWETGHDRFISYWKTTGKLLLSLNDDLSTIKSLLAGLFGNFTSYIVNTVQLFSFEELWRQCIESAASELAQMRDAESYDRLRISRMFDDLRYEIPATVNEEKLVSILHSKLPLLGLEKCYLSLYVNAETPVSAYARLVLAYENEKPVIPLPEGGMAFPANDILPAASPVLAERYSLLVSSVNHSEQKYGFMVFDLDTGKRRVCRALRSIHRTLRNVASNSLYDASLFHEIKQKQLSLTGSLSRLRKTMGCFVEAMSRLVEIRDPYTAGHQHRVADLARSIAIEMGLAADRIESVRLAAQIHDLGKIYVPAEILNKPGKLEDIEFSLIQIHPRTAYDILRPIDFELPIADIILQHHEKMNGSGYPLGLKADDILFEARIICVADVIEAMASSRPYREALGIKAALDEIEKGKTELFDPDVVDTVISLFLRKSYTIIK